MGKIPIIFESTTRLAKEVQAAMGYTFNRECCDSCSHCTELVTPNKDGLETICTLNPAVHFITKPYGYCMFYESSTESVDVGNNLSSNVNKVSTEEL